MGIALFVYSFKEAVNSTNDFYYASLNYVPGCWLVCDIFNDDELLVFVLFFLAYYYFGVLLFLSNSFSFDCSSELFFEFALNLFLIRGD
jgi:hypothetical protein